MSTPMSFANSARARQSNENLYNLGPFEKAGLLDLDAPGLKAYKEAAEALTLERRRVFAETRAAQLVLPKADRIPHYIDKNGEIQKYTPEQLAEATQ